MAASCGAPSTCGLAMAVVRATAVLCGMLLAMSASSACCVPGTLAFTFSLGLLSGMFAKSCGNLLPGTKRQGPSRVDALYQRPEIKR